MTLYDLREHVMFQTNNDVEDLEEFQPAVDKYINEGYNKLVEAYAKTYVGQADESGNVPYPVLATQTDEPQIPSWAHRAIGDFATYMVYRNGNAHKQARGERYLMLFNEVLFKLRYDASKAANGGRRHFYNLYTD